MREVRNLHLGQVHDRAALGSADPDKLAATTVRTYVKAWERVEALGALDLPATEETARQLLAQVPEGCRNSFGGALSAGYHLAGQGEAMASRRYWVYRPDRAELDLGDYTEGARYVAGGLVTAIRRGRRPDIVIACAATTLAYTGARPLELARARREDLVHERRGSRLRLKAKRGVRWVPIVREVAEVLALVPYPSSVWLFPGRGRGRGRSISPCSITHALQRWGAVSAQRFRRLYASWLVEQGLPISVVSGLMGHTSAETMLRYYVRPSAGALMDAAGMVAEALREDAGRIELPASPWARARPPRAANGRARIRTARKAGT